MSSREKEEVHLSLLRKVLTESGLECMRSAPESLDSSTLTGETEEIGPGEEEQEITQEKAQTEEKEKTRSTTEISEEPPDIFPTPSLRRLLPDRMRKIEELNRIHVLPEEFKSDIDPLAIPKIAVTAQQKYIDRLADIVGCTEYKTSLSEFWFLDTLANLLRRAQDDGLDRPTQVILIKWFCQFMKEMQYFDAAERKRMLRRFKDNMLQAARYVAEELRLPSPDDAGVFYKEGQPLPTVRVDQSTILRPSVTFESASYECSLIDLAKIIHYIFDLFSTDYQYNLVRSIFTCSPEYVLIDAPYQINNPKRLYAPLKVKPKKEKSSPKKEKGKKKKQEPDTEDYIALIQLKAREMRQHDDEEDRDREEYNRRSHVLPLSLAATEEFFNQYWPPPPPEPAPEPEPEPKLKGKKGKK